MASPNGDRYGRVIEAIDKVRLMIQTLEATPPSAKRDAALKLLHERHGAAIGRLNELHSDSHRN